MTAAPIAVSRPLLVAISKSSPEMVERVGQELIGDVLIRGVQVRARRLKHHFLDSLHSNTVGDRVMRCLMDGLSRVDRPPPRRGERSTGRC